MLANKISTAFITRIKSPNVRTVKGSVRRSSTGFINVFNTPRTTASIRIVPRLAISTPGSI